MLIPFNYTSAVPLSTHTQQPYCIFCLRLVSKTGINISKRDYTFIKCFFFFVMLKEIFQQDMQRQIYLFNYFILRRFSTCVCLCLCLCVSSRVGRQRVVGMTLNNTTNYKMRTDLNIYYLKLHSSTKGKQFVY